MGERIDYTEPGSIDPYLNNYGGLNGNNPHRFGRVFREQDIQYPALATLFKPDQINSFGTILEAVDQVCGLDMPLDTRRDVLICVIADQKPKNPQRDHTDVDTGIVKTVSLITGLPPIVIAQKIDDEDLNYPRQQVKKVLQEQAEKANRNSH